MHPVAIIAFSLCHGGDREQLKWQLDFKIDHVPLDGR